ncbi:hypothetical protein Prum_064910 [Phytohabitans rumicis]|uniref:Uncharacterized protein n=1 Tax=Phytohabitans rumicis TaxID=1076125 RepID=A0A6V8LE47_9ACTN|nr:hypothetical protein Prum_064910 [Phytohabitans rumicis]
MRVAGGDTESERVRGHTAVVSGGGRMAGAEDDGGGADTAQGEKGSAIDGGHLTSEGTFHK